MKARALIALLIGTAAFAGCREEFVPPERDNNTNGTTNNVTNNVVGPLGNIGDACDGDDGCNPGLVCAESLCEAPGDVEAGQPCYRTAECGDDLYCDQVEGTCAPAGASDEGGSCGGNGDCVKGLVCAPAGFSGECVMAGEKDFGEECEGYFDCIAGLGCAPNLMAPEGPNICQAGVAGLPIPWPGVDCAEDEPGNFRMFFEIPAGDVTEFYRLPYPNDIRLQNGRPNLDGHPTPGEGVLGYDIVQRYIDKIEQVQDGFGLNSWALMRFSETVDFESLLVRGDTATVYVVDLTPASENFGSRVSIRFQASTGGNKYICQNWVAVRPGGDWGRPMAPNSTYGIIVTNGVKSSGGVSATPDDDFAAMLETSRPSGALGDAWDAYQPLRDWVDSGGIDGNTLAGAVVFTTGDPTTEAAALTTPARAEVPTASELTLCDGATTSPCDDGLEGEEKQRGCYNNGGDYQEIQGKLSLPIFQEGESPYLDSGGMATPSVKRREDVCMAMTVPNDTMPENGWPVLVYAHGTGGSYGSHLNDGTVDMVNAIDVDGDIVRFLTVGWDQVQHYTRRGGSNIHPNELVFNYGNPDAAKGNFLQAAADIHAVMAWVEQLNVSAAESPTGEAIMADPTQVYFLGHSQGGTSGPLALPFDTTSQGAVLSGAGAGLILALLGKTTPVNSPAAVQFVLMESSTPSQVHPVLNLLQAYFDPVDPVNFGHLMGAQIIDGVTTPKHIFHTNGVGDTYTPPSGMNAMARALRATYILPFIEEIDGVPSANAPFGSNVNHDAETYSVVGRQYEPAADYDGHFVIFRNETAQGDLQEFLGTGVLLGAPEIR